MSDVDCKAGEDKEAAAAAEAKGAIPSAPLLRIQYRK
jgi:hypothetical protein